MKKRVVIRAEFISTDKKTKKRPMGSECIIAMLENKAYNFYQNPPPNFFSSYFLSFQ